MIEGAERKNEIIVLSVTQCLAGLHRRYGKKYPATQSTIERITTEVGQLLATRDISLQDQDEYAEELSACVEMIALRVLACAHDKASEGFFWRGDSPDSGTPFEMYGDALGSRRLLACILYDPTLDHSDFISPALTEAINKVTAALGEAAHLRIRDVLRASLDIGKKTAAEAITTITVDIPEPEFIAGFHALEFKFTLISGKKAVNAWHALVRQGGYPQDFAALAVHAHENQKSNPQEPFVAAEIRKKLPEPYPVESVAELAIILGRILRERYGYHMHPLAALGTPIADHAKKEVHDLHDLSRATKLIAELLPNKTISYLRPLLYFFCLVITVTLELAHIDLGASKTNVHEIMQRHLTSIKEGVAVLERARPTFRKVLAAENDRMKEVLLNAWDTIATQSAIAGIHYIDVEYNDLLEFVEKYGADPKKILQHYFDLRAHKISHLEALRIMRYVSLETCEAIETLHSYHALCQLSVDQIPSDDMVIDQPAAWQAKNKLQRSDTNNPVIKTMLAIQAPHDLLAEGSPAFDDEFIVEILIVLAWLRNPSTDNTRHPPKLEHLDDMGTIYPFVKHLLSMYGKVGPEAIQGRITRCSESQEAPTHSDIRANPHDPVRLAALAALANLIQSTK